MLKDERQKLATSRPVAAVRSTDEAMGRYRHGLHY